jgi:hypothetical protein
MDMFAWKLEIVIPKGYPCVFPNLMHTSCPSSGHFGKCLLHFTHSLVSETNCQYFICICLGAPTPKTSIYIHLLEFIY